MPLCHSMTHEVGVLYETKDLWLLSTFFVLHWVMVTLCPYFYLWRRFQAPSFPTVIMPSTCWCITASLDLAGYLMTDCVMRTCWSLSVGLVWREEPSGAWEVERPWLLHEEDARSPGNGRSLEHGRHAHLLSVEGTHFVHVVYYPTVFALSLPNYFLPLPRSSPPPPKYNKPKQKIGFGKETPLPWFLMI